MKKIIAIILLFSAAISLTACGSGQTTANIGKDSRRPDFGQPEREADISGIVESITGNEITVLKMESPNKENQENTEKNADNNEADGQSRNLGTAFSGTVGGPAMGGGMRNRSQMDSEQQAQMLARLKEMGAGEETIIIPVGIQMLKPDGSDDQEQMSMSEAALSDITADKMISVWLDESITEKNIATFVLIN